MDTIKYGKRRRHCPKCNYTFRPFKKKRIADKRWSKTYILDGSTYTRLGQRWKVSKSTAWRSVHHTLDSRVKVSTLMTLSIPDHIINCLLDAKHFTIRKKVYTFYAAFNYDSNKPIAWILLPRYELRYGYDVILRHLIKKKCIIKAFVSDWHHGICSSIRDNYPASIHQRCAAHVLQDAFRKLGGKRFLATGLAKDIWPIYRHVCLGFKKFNLARMYLGKICKRYPEYHKANRVVKRSLKDIYQFEKANGFTVLRTSNQIENFMGIIEQRLKTFRGHKTPESLIKIITNLILLKFKKPTNL